MLLSRRVLGVYVLFWQKKAFVTEGRRRDRLNPPIIFSVSFSFLLSSFFRRLFLFPEDHSFFQKN